MDKDDEIKRKRDMAARLRRLATHLSPVDSAGFVAEAAKLEAEAVSLEQLASSRPPRAPVLAQTQQQVKQQGEQDPTSTPEDEKD